VAKNAIQPVTVFRADGWICQVLPPTNVWISPWVVAPVSDTPVLSHPNQTVGTVVEFLLSRQTFPISVAIGGVPHHLVLGLAGILLIYLLARHQRGCHGCCQDENQDVLVHLYVDVDEFVLDQGDWEFGGTR